MQLTERHSMSVNSSSLKSSFISLLTVHDYTIHSFPVFRKLDVFVLNLISVF